MSHLQSPSKPSSPFVNAKTVIIHHHLVLCIFTSVALIQPSSPPQSPASPPSPPRKSLREVLQASERRKGRTLFLTSSPTRPLIGHGPIRENPADLSADFFRINFGLCFLSLYQPCDCCWRSEELLEGEREMGWRYDKERL